jgi:hypothetical protein
LLATQVPATDYVSVKQLSPTGFSQHEFFTSPSSGAGNFRREFDPAGATVPLFNHSPGHGGSPGEIPAGGGALDGRFGDMSDPGAGCTLDGVWVPCSMAYRALGSGAASVASVSGAARVGLGRKAIWMEGDTSVGSIDPITGAVTIRATGGHFEWIPDTDQFWENSISMRALLPQNPALPTDLKHQVQNTVTNCADYMNSLLNVLGSKYTAETFAAETPGNLFDRVGMDRIKIDHKEFERLGEPTASGLAEYNPRRIFINSTVTAIARVTTFELLHHAANRGSFDDYALDNAVIALMDPEARRKAEQEKQAKGYKRASIAHKELNAKCFNLRKPQ